MTGCVRRNLFTGLKDFRTQSGTARSAKPRKYGHLVLVNRLEVLSLPRNRVARLTDRPDMIIAVYTSIQMKCQGGVIFVHAPRLFYCPKRRIGYARCSLTGNKTTQL